MGNKLYIYDGFNPSGETIYSGWEPKDAYIFQTEEYFNSLTGYTDITTIKNLDSIGHKIGLNHIQTKKEIKDLYDSQTGTTWGERSLGEKKVIAKYFLVEKSLRDEVLTQQEQDIFNHYKIYDFLSEDVLDRLGELNEKITPKSIDYKKEVNKRFNPEYAFSNSGFLTGVTYYENLNIQQSNGINVYNYSNPIVKYSALYFQNSDGYVTHRIVDRAWQMMDGTWSTDIKTSLKMYDSKQSREEGNRRRRNLINNLLIDTVGVIFMTSNDLTTISETESDAIPFLTEVDSGIQLYYESGAKKNGQGESCLLIQQTLSSTYSRLDNIIPPTSGLTIRDYIVNRLTP